MDVVGHENIAPDINVMTDSRIAEIDKDRMDGWTIQDHFPVEGTKGDKVNGLPDI